MSSGFQSGKSESFSVFGDSELEGVDREDNRPHVTALAAAPNDEKFAAWVAQISQGRYGDFIESL